MEVAITDLRVGRLLVFLWLHTKNDPSDEEWERAFDLMSTRRRREGVPFADMRSLVISDGGAPGGVQRVRIGREFPFKSSVITTVLSNPVKRGIATALSWVNPRYFFGAPKDALRASEHLDLADQWDVMWPLFLQMQKQLPRNEALELVATVLKRAVS
jgi:hypothetical protein